MKPLFLGLLLVSPALGAWIFHRTPELDCTASGAIIAAVPAHPPAAIVRVPVEVIAKGSAPQWIYVQVGSQSVPEPGTATLLVLTSLLLLHRRRI